MDSGIPEANTMSQNVQGALVSDKDEPFSVVVPRKTKALYKEHEGSSLLEILLRKESPSDREAASNQGSMPGTRYHPFDFNAVINFDDANEYHSACVKAKVAATVGLGFVTEEEKKVRKAKMSQAMGMETPMSIRELPEPDKAIAKVDTILNPLCRITWQDTVVSMDQDFEKTGNGYLEIIRNLAGKITGIHHLPAKEVHYFLEDYRGTHHFEICGSESPVAPLRFACFGDKQGFLDRITSPTLPVSGMRLANSDPEMISEVIHFRMPTNKDRWYGHPDWLSAVAAVELMQMITQHNFDYYQNRGVPELLVTFLGIPMTDEQKKMVADALKSHIGLGNAFKTLFLQFPEISEHSKVQVEKLGEVADAVDKLASSRDSLSLGIVSAHSVPPMLAGIQIPGKLGAVNELPNSLAAFQLLCIGLRQRVIYQTLGATLAHPVYGVEGLNPEDFELKRITDEIDIGSMDTVSRMRQSPMQARNEGRDLSSGVKE